MYNSLQSSPSKRSFRSRPKHKDFTPELKKKQVVSFKLYMKEYPLNIAEDVIRVLSTFQPIHTKFLDNLENLKLYKSGLASQFEDNWVDFMNIVRQIVTKLNKRADKLTEAKELKITQLLNLNNQLEHEKQKYKDKLASIQHLRQLERAQLEIANNQVDVVNRQMSDIYQILQNNMEKVLKYLMTVEEKKNKEIKADTDNVYESLESLKKVLNGLEMEKKEAGSTLNTMRQLIKAMTRSTKSTTGTQVDESELQTNAVDIFTSGQTDIPYEHLEATALNTISLANPTHVLDKLKLKERQHGHETIYNKKNPEKAWALTPTLLIFLENMSKENESGRVLPWQHMKNIISDIYEERLKSQLDMISGMVGNAMLFDEFVVFYFLKKQKIRRLAEVKVLEFIISLKYYSKFWIKAETFCMLMDVMKYVPSFEVAESNNYRLDYYSQNFFFQVYRQMRSFDLVHDEDGTVYVPVKKVKKLIKVILFFSDEISRSRISAKVEKDIRIFDRVECTDFDHVILLFLEEYFASRKRISSALGKSFSKLNQKTNGFISIDELLGVFNQFSKLYTEGQNFPHKYPIQSPLQTAKLYLYAITSSKNDYEISTTQFLQSCQRYGFDAPFPFIHVCPKFKQKKVKEQGMEQMEELPTDSHQSVKKTEERGNVEIKGVLVVDEKEKEELKKKSLNEERIDVTSKLFAQHFCILKQLKDYVKIFGMTLQNEKDPELVWKSFNQIKLILQKGCSFLQYPLVSHQNAWK